MPLSLGERGCAEQKVPQNPVRLSRQIAAVEAGRLGPAREDALAHLDGPGRFTRLSPQRERVEGRLRRVFRLGLEERVKAVRNARTQESTRGVLGGDTEMRTQVEITVRSSLPAPVELLLLDRVPVSGTEDAKVTMELEKECVAYNQVDRGRFVRGGIRWKATLAPGEERTFRFAYTIVFSSKMEIEGGNRRD